ncbi:MAG: ATP-binding cassette domain-containing protein, partial [Paracoccaceae bacterium]|nr:ATP-binding cassette domain-containing protein [Paracoccaceae bacterium]
MISALSLHAVTKRFGGLVAVNRLEFDVVENQVMGLIGPNGSGKSTVLNLISGAFPLSAGTIRMHGNIIS